MKEIETNLSAQSSEDLKSSDDCNADMTDSNGFFIPKDTFFKVLIIFARLTK
jgi:hypothetical protein